MALRSRKLKKYIIHSVGYHDVSRVARGPVSGFPNHHVQVDLAHKLDLYWVDLLAGTEAIMIRYNAFDANLYTSSILFKYDVGLVCILSITWQRHFELK
jgi:hypothetical protein